MSLPNNNHVNVYTLIITLLFVVAIGTFAYLYSSDTSVAEAAPPAGSIAVEGYAWSDTIGWISFAGTSTDYGVYLATSTGALSGYAWSDVAGWISFESSDVSGCPSGSCDPVVSTSTYEVSGWARILSESGSGEGWISLNGTEYGVSINSLNGEFEGWAWDSDTAGWISFNCDGDLGCDTGTEDYNVYIDPGSGFFASDNPSMQETFVTQNGFVGDIYEISMRASDQLLSLSSTGLLFDDSVGGAATKLRNTTRSVKSGNYLYTVSYTEDSLGIINISDPASPTEVGVITDNNVGGSATALNNPQDVAVSGNYAYVVTNIDDSLSVIDISNPLSPVEVAYLLDDVAGGSASGLEGATAIDVEANYAFVTSIPDSSLSIIDISDPLNPIEVGIIRDDSVGGAATNLSRPEDVDVVGDYAYVVDGSDSQSALSIFDISDPSNITQRDVIQDNNSGGTATGLQNAIRVIVEGGYAYTLSSGEFSDRSFSIFDISNPNAISEVAVLSPTWLGGTEEYLELPSDIAIVSDYAIVSDWQDDAVNLINITDPANPFTEAIILDDEASDLSGADLVVDYIDGAGTVNADNEYLYVTSGQDSALTVLRYVERDSIRYGIDWDATDADDTVDEWIPNSGYVLSNTTATTTYSWNTAGSHTFRILAEDDEGKRSGWMLDDINIYTRSPYAMARDIQTESLTNPSSVTAQYPELSALYAESTQFEVFEGPWGYYREVYVRNDHSENLADYQVQVSIDTDALVSNGKLESQCQDLRFIDPYADEVVPHYFDASECNTPDTTVWLKTPSLPANATTTLVMFYGNPAAPNASNGDDVFIFFDDFEDADFNEWNTSIGWTIDVTHARNGAYGARSGTNWSEVLSINLDEPLISGILDADVRFSSTGISHFYPFNPRLAGGSDTEAYWAVPLGNVDDDVAHWIGPSFQYYPTRAYFTDSVWYNYELKFDFSSGADGKHWLYIDNTNYGGAEGVDIVGYNGGTHSSLSGWYLRVSDPDNGQYYWIDNVRIRAFGAHNIEPTVMLSSTENQSGFIAPSDAIAYQIQVIAFGGDWGTLLWDSGKSTTTRTLGTRESQMYGDSSLNTDGQKYFQRWRFWNNVDQATVWSDGADEWSMLNDPIPSVPTFVSNPATGSVGEALTFEFESHDRLATSSDGLLIGFEMEEGVGSTLGDDSVENNSGSIQPNALWSGDAYESNYAIEFDGTNDSYVRVGDSFSLASALEAVTYEAWVKFDNTSVVGTTAIISRQDTVAELATSTVGGFALGASLNGPSSNNVAFSVVDEGGSSIVAEPASANMNADTWYHIVGIFDNSNDQAQTRLYINGVEVVNQTNPGWGNAGLIAKDLTIGGDPNSDSLTPEEFRGIIDNVRVYNRALTPAEIADHYTVFDQIRYGIDWDNNDTVDEWVPTNVPSDQYVTSGTVGATTTSWGSPGDYTFKVLAEDDRGGLSAWATHTVTIADSSLLPTVVLNPLSDRILYDTNTSINWSVADAGLGCTVYDGTTVWQSLVPITPDDSGLQSTGSLTATTTFSMSCENAYGTYATSAIVGVIEPECRDGKDNDSIPLGPNDPPDGADGDDSACYIRYDIEDVSEVAWYHATGTSESEHSECSDGIDNDLDGETDAGDGGCYVNYNFSNSYEPAWDREQTCGVPTNGTISCDVEAGETFGTCPSDCRRADYFKIFEF